VSTMAVMEVADWEASAAAAVLEPAMESVRRQGLAAKLLPDCATWPTSVDASASSKPVRRLTVCACDFACASSGMKARRTASARTSCAATAAGDAAAPSCWEPRGSSTAGAPLRTDSKACGR
jgi:hypothetical protein